MTNNKYSNLVNFKTNLNQGRPSWFEIKEGYSFDLLDNVLKDVDNAFQKMKKIV